MIPIVFSTDHNYVMPTGVTICSLLKNAIGELYDIFILAGKDVDEIDRQMLTRQVVEISPDSKISFIDMGESFKDSFEIRGISTACYYRLLIPWLIPQYDKIIYSDVDIIYRTGLSEIYELELGDNYVAGAHPGSEQSWKDVAKYLHKIGLDESKYINSGFLLINAGKQRELELDKEYQAHALKNYIYQDQDIINIVCRDRIAYFDRRFNLAAKWYKTSADVNDKVVIHYAGNKPWETFTYAWDEWWRIYNESIFYNDNFYHAAYSKMLNPKTQLINITRSAYRKIRVIISKYI